MNNPVHIIDKSGHVSPSSFIPFCELGGNPDLMGIKIEQFDFPVCNSFTEKILNGQLCYQVNIDELKKHKPFTNTDLQIGLTLLLDYNSDRTLKSSNEQSTGKSTKKGLVYFTETSEALINIGSISNTYFNNLSLSFLHIFCFSPNRVIWSWSL